MVSVTAVVLKQPSPGKATHFMDDCFVNLGENVILTLRWQSGASESATVCFGISLSICYWLLRVCVCVCVCVRVWEREREGVTSQHISYLYRGLCVCVWDWETVTSQQSVQLVRNRLNRGLCANTYELHHCVFHVTLFPFRAWTDAKLRTLLTVFILILNAEACDYERGVTFPTRLMAFGQSQCTVPAGQSEQTEGGTL